MNRPEHKDRRFVARGILYRDGGILAVRPVGTDDWVLPGGGVDDGEWAHTTVVREFLEETGLAVDVLREVMEASEPGNCLACAAMRRVLASDTVYPFTENDKRDKGCIGGTSWWGTR